MKSPLALAPLVILIALTVGCQDRQALAELEEMKAQTEVEEQNKALVTHLMQEFDKKNLDIVVEMNTPDYQMHFPIGAEPLTTSQHRELIKTFWEAFPDMTHTIDRLVAERDMVTGQYTIRATHTGEFMGIPSTGNEIAETVIGFWRFSDGKVAEFWGIMDMASLYQQLGMELRPAVGK
jgi:steroid delta-isomerase-like uncharacterized protein